MNDIGKRISQIRRERGYNQEQLAEMAMLNRVTLARYETNAIEPGAFALSRIADALGVSTDELLCRTEKLPPFINMIKNAVPVVGEIACGTPITAEQNIEGYADLPDGVSADFALTCRGDSMLPLFNDGDLVLIRQQPDVEEGEIAAVGIQRDGITEATLKHVYRQNGGLLLCASNPKYAPQLFTEDDLPTIYGKAVGYVRKL